MRPSGSTRRRYREEDRLKIGRTNAQKLFKLKK